MSAWKLRMDAWIYECDWLTSCMDVWLDQFLIHYIIDSY